MPDGLPRTILRGSDQQSAPGAALDDRRLLLAVESGRGVVDGPIRLRNARDLARNLERVGAGIRAWDLADVALRERVPEVFLTRIVGPAATAASIALAGAGGASFSIASTEPGAWANGATGGLAAEVIAGPGGAGERVVIIRRKLASGTVEVGRTTALTSRAALMAAVEQIDSLPPRREGGPRIPRFKATAGTDVGVPNIAAEANFAGGVDDSAGITTTHMRAALDRVPLAWGPMQVVAPGRNTDAANTELLRFAFDTERTALLEQEDGLAVGSIAASAGTLRALGRGAEGIPRLGGMWAQHATGPGYAPGTSRTVPWTIIVAGLTARLQADQGHANVAPFADFGVPMWATGLTREFSEADSETLFAAGCNLAHVDPVLGLRNRTFRTLEPNGESAWVDLAHTRLDRAVWAQARDVGRNMGARSISRNDLKEFGARLSARLERMWRAGALYGDTPDEAFRVDVDSVNDTESIRNKEVNAAVSLTMNEHAEFVRIDVAKVPIGQEV